MPGVLQRPKHVPQSIRLNGLSLSLGHSKEPPRCDAVALFGPPKFTAQQQAENPDSPMTRVVKDVLQVGRWNVGGPRTPSMWDVTPEILQAVADSVAVQQASGCAVNVGLSHGEPTELDPGLVPTGELVTPIDAVAVSGGALWMACYMTPRDAAKYRNPAFKVSPGLMWGYVDGTGTQHQLGLVHVAITDRPVVAGQGPFLAMANASQTSFLKGKAMDFAALKDAINAILAAAGLGALDDSVSEENLVERLAGMAAVIKSMKGEPEAPETPEGGDSSLAVPGDAAGGVAMNNKAITAAIAAALKPLQQQIVSLSNQVNANNANAVKSAKASFDAECIRLGGMGVSAAVIQEKRDLGASANWDIRLLNGLQPVVTMSNKSKSGATGEPQKPGGEGEAPKARADVVKEFAARKGITVEAAEKFVPL